MKNSHGRTGNQTRDLIICSQKLWPLDHEAGHVALNIQACICSHDTRTRWISAVCLCATVAVEGGTDTADQLLRHGASTEQPCAVATGVLYNRHFTTHHIHCCWRYGKFKNGLDAATSVQSEYTSVTLSLVLSSAFIVAKFIYYFLWLCSPARAMASSSTSFLDHTRLATFGRTPLDEWSARRRDLYLTTHNRQTSMPSVGFKPTIAAGERP
jgi:hypothetical protein